MREKILKIADRLIKRADEYEKPFRGVDRTAFYASASYPVTTTLREIAYQIKAELSAPDETDCAYCKDMTAAVEGADCHCSKCYRKLPISDAGWRTGASDGKKSWDI